MCLGEDIFLPQWNLKIAPKGETILIATLKAVASICPMSTKKPAKMRQGWVIACPWLIAADQPFLRMEFADRSKREITRIAIL